MSADPCDEMQLLLQADIDGELGPADSARVVMHLDGCAACASQQAQLAALKHRIRQASYHPAPEPLRRSMAALAPALRPLFASGARPPSAPASRWQPPSSSRCCLGAANA